jgi:DNA polymerase III delta prime subunit
MLVGHQGVIGALSSQLPPVSIITGPPSVGKRLIAAQAARINNVARVDFTEVSRLTVDEATRIKSFMRYTPTRDLKFALIDLDSASEGAVDKLLKTLEEPASYARFSLISSKRLPGKLLTRGHKYKVGFLNQDELLSILLAKGIPENEASKVSNLGRVDLALQAYADVAAKTTAISVLQAVEANDYELFMQAYKGVDEKAAHAIVAALEESASQNWKMFNPNYLGAFNRKNVALTVLGAWSNVASARPQLAVRVALESVMRG